MTVGQPCTRHPEWPLVGVCDRCGDFGCAQCIPTGRSCTRCVPVWDVPKPDLAKSFTSIFQDPAWGWKVAAGALCTLLGFFLVPMFLLVGYQMKIARSEREAPRSGLPEWENPGSLLWDGFKAYLCLALPMFLVYAVSFAVLMVAVGAMVGFGAKPPARGAGPPPAFIGLVLMAELLWIGCIFAYGALIPAIQIQYLRTGSVLAAFHVRSLWRIISGHPVDYVLFVLMAFVLYFVSTIVGELMCLVGLFATMPIGLYLEGHFLGRYCAWLDAAENVG